MPSRCVGICSLCSGPVMMPDVWYSVKPPVPTCEVCHATAAPQVPVMQMVPSLKPLPPLLVCSNDLRASLDRWRQESSGA
jgi:hypothetical protein